MNVYWMILRQAFRAQSRVPTIVSVGGVLFLGACIFAWMAFGIGDTILAAKGLALGLGLLLLQVIIAFVQLVLSDLGQPSQACLVPQARQRIFSIVAALWVMFTGIIGALYGFANGNILTGVLVVGFMLNNFILAMSGYRWLYLAIAAWPVLDFARFTTVPALFFLSVFVILAGMVAIIELVANGGDRHFARTQESRRNASLLKEGRSKSSMTAGFAVAAHRNLVQRLAIGLDMYQPVRKYIRVMGLGAAFVAVLAWIDKSVIDLGPHAASASGSLAVLILIFVGNRAHELLLNLTKTVAEQQLLSFAPVLPRGEAANRLLLKVLLEQWLFSWLGIAFFGISLLVIGADGASVRIFFAISLAAFATLPSLFNEDLARLVDQPARQWRWMTFVLQLGLLIALSFMERLLAPFAGVAVGAAIGLAGLLHARRLWLKRLKGSELLPVGSQGLFEINSPGGGI